MSEIAITPFDPKDEIALGILLQSAELSTEDITPEMLEHFLVAHAGKTLAGAVGLEVLGEVGLLRSVAVDEPHRGTGLGTRLVEAMEEHARGEGLQQLYLLTTTAESFFAGLGYRTIPRGEAPEALTKTAQYAELCPSSSTLMVKSILVPV